MSARRWRFCLTLVVLLTMLLPASAHAAVAWVECTSRGATGVKATTYVMHRFTGVAEGYFVGLDHDLYIRPDGIKPSLAWEIYEFGIDNYFRPVAHIYYKIGDSNYTNDEYVWWMPQQVSTGWNHLEITLRPNTTTWDCRINGYLSRSSGFWWPYTGGNVAWTAVEVGPPSHQLTSSSYFFMGRINQFYLRTSAGAWSRFDTAWSHRLAYGVQGAPAYSVMFNQYYYDWEARR